MPGEGGRGPVARGDAFRFPKVLIEHRSESGADSGLPFVAALPENVIKVDDSPERYAQLRPNLPTVIPQSQTDLQNPLRLKQIRNKTPALRSMKLEDESSISKRKLDNVRAASFFPGAESWF